MHKRIAKVLTHHSKVMHFSLIAGIMYGLGHEGAGLADWLFLVLAIVAEIPTE